MEMAVERKNIKKIPFSEKIQNCDLHHRNFLKNVL